MTRWAALGCVIMALAMSNLGAAENAQPEPRNPEWCHPPGKPAELWVCRPMSWAVDLDLRLNYLEMKAKRQDKHFHWLQGTCGPAASLDISGGKTNLAGTLSCVMGPGISF